MHDERPAQPGQCRGAGCATIRRPCDAESPDPSEATTGLASSLIGTVLSGRYRLESKLGSGGMSTVFLARDETLERWVAVKVMHREISDQPDQIERFRREARAVAQLSHPNVVAVIDAGRGRRLSVHRLRVRRGRDAEAADRSARAACRSTRPPPTRSRSAAGSPRRTPAAGPPRRQAAERPDRRRGPGQGHRLRHRPLARVRRPDQDRAGARHDRLRRAGAGDGPGRRRPLGHLLARRPALRDADRRGPVPGRDRWSGSR